ncbi:hypothetical protein P691DRAFT_466122 [Macrolepiota fuliginosa MF-IS2]|uniref:Nephrocystin 3-like N-terminal domain-containing protein n=1 Tax=Macrolepiota fuliginosa MF-IS2 TaxID=1400762 RepID=A0A9P5XGV4_9AGAR|nr:hypothetical protein P691DRAFT_466122 [Macrolepiota fuliginosa MF-IS2]
MVLLPIHDFVEDAFAATRSDGGVDTGVHQKQVDWSPDQASMNFARGKIAPHIIHHRCPSINITIGQVLTSRSSVLHCTCFNTMPLPTNRLNCRPEIVKICPHPADGKILALSELESHTIQGADLNGAGQFTPPQCYPGTQRVLREIITARLNRTQQSVDWRFLWFYGPPYVGKSSLARSIAKECDDERHLAAAIFFSRAHKRNKSSLIVLTLVYQLAGRYPEYHDFIVQELDEDPHLLRRDLATQFERLIEVPFHKLAEANSPLVQQRLLVILDGLDECEPTEQMDGLMKIICNIAVDQLPLLWVVCSRLKPHMGSAFASLDPSIVFRQEVVGPDNAELLSFAQSGFQQLRRAHPDISVRWVDRGDHWPLTPDLDRIVGAAPGSFLFTSTLLRFVGDVNTGGVPPNRLTGFWTPSIGTLDGYLLLNGLGPIASTFFILSSS